MDKIKKNKKKKDKIKSIKQTFLIYIPICAILVYMGAYAIGIGSNYLQEWYWEKIFAQEFSPHDDSIVVKDTDGNIYYSSEELAYLPVVHPIHHLVYGIISWAQAILIPAWVLFCVAVTAKIFYKREMEKPILVLFHSSEKISENCLDFQIESTKSNELGRLCESFETMRAALYKNNQKMWRMLEERKRLNAAFSHDIRTPITVLKGYTELLEKYIPDGKISQDKLLEIIGMMNGQIKRLENYTYKMSEVQKLEDIAPRPEKVKWNTFLSKCVGIGDMLKGNLQLAYANSSDEKELWIDEELVLEVYENLLSNGVRYARDKVSITISVKEEILEIIIEDDGQGFSEEALKRATEPFYRDEKKGNENFGLGLYICKVICEKNKGKLTVENGISGGKIRATFEVKV